MDDATFSPRPPREQSSNGSEAPERTSGHARAALFVDFDNIYIGLQQQDPSAAEAFARNPEGWLNWLHDWVPEEGSTGALSRRRSVLLRKCYLNPGAFGRYRPYFVRAGFQVVDCPSLTAQGKKNGADIQMVMDILDALEHRTRFDEFILLSGDSDFTPVLLRLRAYDRRTAILAVGLTAAAFRAACDVMLTEETFIEQALQIPSADEQLLLRPSEPFNRPAQSQMPAPRAPRPAGFRPDGGNGYELERDQRRRDSALLISGLVGQSASPIPSATVAQKLIDRFGIRLRDSAWDGTGGFRAFVESLGANGFTVSWAIPGYFYDPVRHQLPDNARLAQSIETGDQALNDLALRIHELTDTPLLTPAQFGAVFTAVAEEVDAHGYFLTQTSRNVRDICRERGVPVPRPDISFILKGLVYSGSLRGLAPAVGDAPRAGDSNDPQALASAFCQNVVRLCERNQLTLTEQEVAQIRGWILGEIVEPPAES